MMGQGEEGGNARAHCKLLQRAERVVLEGKRTPESAVGAAVGVLIPVALTRTAGKKSVFPALVPQFLGSIDLIGRKKNQGEILPQKAFSSGSKCSARRWCWRWCRLPGAGPPFLCWEMMNEGRGGVRACEVIARESLLFSYLGLSKFSEKRIRPCNYL